MTTPSSSQKHRSRRIDDALGQLVESLVPLSSARDDEELQPYAKDFARVEDERRVRRALEHAYEVLEAYNAEAAHPDPAESGIVLPTPETINSAPDMIKRKLLHENESPDRAVAFSNLYSRLLTQPVLSQKWAILYLLYRLGQDDGFEEDMVPPEEINQFDNLRYSVRDGLRSPPNNDNHFENMLYKERLSGRRYAPDSIAPESSASMAAFRRAQEELLPPLPPSAPPDRMRFDFPEDHELRSIPHRRQVSISNGNRETRPPTRDNQRQSNLQQPPQQASIQSPPPTAIPKEEPPIKQTTEREILRDLPFVLQGVSSTNMHFSGDTLKLPQSLPVPVISLLHTLAEPCLLYRKLSAFLEKEEGGLIDQGLRSAVSHELRSYLGLVAALETEIRTALQALSKEGESPASNAVKVTVTLKRCVVWMRDATMALRLLTLIIEEAKGNRGGQLISMIHGFSTSHGDPFVSAFAERLLSHVTRPFYGMLTQWIYDGELSDPYREFFVVQPEHRPTADPRRIATSVWDDKYKMDDEMVPSIMSQEFARKVFLIGKSLNFIRYGCGDSSWVVAYSKEASKELKYGDTATLEKSIDEAYKTTMARLIFLMDTRFKLFDHLHALKKYLLLGQGDFIALLMESLASNLDRPANSQYRHTLTAQLENAIRSSNAQYDSPDVLRRLDARMLELSHGESGWDCFTLEYKIDAPVNVVITPWGSTQYLKVFNFLWRVKRVEFALSSTWRRCITGARGVLGAVDDKVGPDWKRARCMIAEMNHFIAQLQYYILFEVIESSWDQLQVAIKKPGCTLDDLIEAHAKYLNAITHKGLLGGSARTKSSNQEEPFLSQLHHILKIMLVYKDAVDGLYSFSVAEYTRRQELKAKIATRTAQGRMGDLPTSGIRTRATTLASTEMSLQGVTFRSKSHSESHSSHPHLSDILQSPGADSHSEDTVSHPAGEDHLLPALRSRLRDLAKDFRTRLITLLSDLAYQPDVDMRFLALVMNFNDVYPVRRKRREGTNGASSSSKERKKTAEATASSSGRQRM
ncbi:Gamma tubulin complex protein 3 [Ascosphaera apis ARSEF 7405]|uniref:Gamma tubulin complex protein 3 n=1 Tax=Ascosphaera apis ARSEF 7405 TaxID=392613 RepID=A0A168CCR7_9EURO|nr:Gamma tubulin complex protein 3 [Ascosphaera apis ARSEF 7405]